MWKSWCQTLIFINCKNKFSNETFIVVENPKIFHINNIKSVFFSKFRQGHNSHLNK